MLLRKRPAIKYLTFDPTSGPEASVPGPAPAPAPAPNNDFFQEFMRTYIERVQNQAPIAPNAEAREDALDRPLKPRNPTCIMAICIWSATTSVSNARTISRLSGH